MTVPRSKSVAKATPSSREQVDAFIAKFDPAVAKLIRACRAAMRRALPGANELVYDNYNFFVIGYCASEKPSESIVSLACSKKGVALAFLHGNDLPDPDGLLLGSGVQNRFVRLPSARTLAEPGVKALLRAAVAQSKTPFARGARGKTIMRSISPKQRARR